MQDENPPVASLAPGRATDRTLIAVAVLASFVAFLDGSVVNLALPAIAADLAHTGLAGLALQQWVVDGYLLALGALILVAGAVSDQFGRLTVLRTSETQAGEIFIPQINLLLAVGVVFLVGIFHTSSAMAHAYGLAVTGTMVVTTVLAFIVVTRKWRWPLWGALALVGGIVLLLVKPKSV